ncbi:unnamed protein product [Nyctereutes procyonoides]|uniref:(raccoon dog) hypothetical protein n=1 Tax=Nyctereutes procyonoides TaxID=34880 RepID=A0A811XTG1_NYCPR|nr:unnamed protein product [Nyctereutes procyonoides]
MHCGRAGAGGGGRAQRGAPEPRAPSPEPRAPAPSPSPSPSPEPPPRAPDPAGRRRAPGPSLRPERRERAAAEGRGPGAGRTRGSAGRAPPAPRRLRKEGETRRAPSAPASSAPRPAHPLPRAAGGGGGEGEGAPRKWYWFANQSLDMKGEERSRNRQTSPVYGGDKDSGQMIVPVENRTCALGLGETEVGSFRNIIWLSYHTLCNLTAGSPRRCEEFPLTEGRTAIHPSWRKLQKPVHTERTFGVWLPTDMSPGMDLTCCVAFGKSCSISALFPCLC